MGTGCDGGSAKKVEQIALTSNRAVKRRAGKAQQVRAVHLEHREVRALHMLLRPEHWLAGRRPRRSSRKPLLNFSPADSRLSGANRKCCAGGQTDVNDPQRTS